MRVLLLVVLAACFWSVLLSAEAPAAGAAGEGTRWELVERRVAAAETQLAAVTQRVEAAQRGQREWQSHRQNLEREQQRVEAERQKIESVWQDLEQRLVKRRADLTELQTLSRQRLRALYLLQPAGIFDYLFGSGPLENAGRQAFYLGRIRTHDMDLLRQLGETLQLLESEEQQLLKLRQARESLSAKLAQKRSEVEAGLRRQEELARALARDQAEQEELLVELRAEALRLETVMVGLTSSRVEPERPAVGSTRRSLPAMESFVGTGLKSQSQSLVVPVKGRVLQGFGQRNIDGFSDMVFGRGLELEVAKEAKIQAIAAARVIFSGVLPAYGAVVILDHGERTYSLYGRLGGIVAQVGDIVESGAALGMAAAPEAGRANFYFEIREGSNAVDPAGYFSARDWD